MKGVWAADVRFLCQQTTDRAKTGEGQSKGNAFKAESGWSELFFNYMLT